MAISYGTYTITEVQEGSQIWTSSVAPSSPNYTFTVSKLVGDSDVPVKVGDIIMYSYYRYTVLSISSDRTTVLTGNRASIRGGTGAASTTYTLIVSNFAVVKDKNGDISPTSITLTAKSQTGANAMANYAGRFKIETTTDNSTWTTQYTSTANEATKDWNVIDNIIAIRCSLYLKDGTTTLLDQQTIPIVSDGVDGTNITITSTSVTYQKGTSGTIKPTGTWETGIPSIGQGEYLWTKTVVAYSDSSKTESYSVSRNAVNGTNGTNGKDGTSPTVTSTVTEYVQSDSGTTTPTSGWNTTPPTATAGKYMWTKVTVTYSDNATAVSYTVSKNGTNGSNGINTATVYLYKRGTTAPSVPSGNTTYTFSTKKLTGTLDSWSQTIPTTGDGECYVTAAVASSNGTTDTIGTGEWSTPIQFNGTNGTNGTDGTNGLNQATIFLYKRGASVTKPTTSVTYIFSTGSLSAEPNSWKRNIPTIDGSPCWVVTATAIGSGTTATITGSNWSDPVKLVEDGEDGNDAYSIILTNENHTFAGDTTSAIASEIECNVIAYKGATQVASTIGTITGQPTGMTTTLLNNGTVNSAFRVSVTTSMITKNGVLNVPVTVDGKVFTKKFTYTLTLDGEDGKDGGRWYSGTKITGTSTTATVFSGSGITSAVVGDMYLNTSTYNTYRCTLGGNASTAKWIYVNNIKGTTGKGISSITNQYYLSTSDTTQSGGSWSDTPQTYVEGRYYWTRSHIVWDDGGSPTNTTPVLDNALTDANANAINARKVATNYLSVDSTGIMVADLEDGEQTPSAATGNNVFINNTSVNIRDGQTILASFGSSGIQIGTTSTSVNIDRDSFDLKRNNNEYVHLGYGEGNAQSGTAVAPYYSIGTRKANSAVGNYSVAEGSNNEASGYASNAQGYNNTASGLMSHAEGYNNTASGAYSSAEGSGNTVSGTTSHVGGLNSIVSGNGSFTHGYGLLGSGDNQAVFGRYNIEDTNYEYAMIIGNGTVDENYTPVRSNLLTVGWDGNIKTASGFDTSMPPFKWKSASYTVSNLASGYTDVTTDVSFPNLAGYSKTIMVVGTNSAYTGATGAYIDNSNKVHIRCRNFSSSASSPTISFILIYLNNTYTWT